jgi:hypothetical protein
VTTCDAAALIPTAAQTPMAMCAAGAWATLSRNPPTHRWALGSPWCGGGSLYLMFTERLRATSSLFSSSDPSSSSFRDGVQQEAGCSIGSEKEEKQVQTCAVQEWLSAQCTPSADVCVMSANEWSAGRIAILNM